MNRGTMMTFELQRSKYVLIISYISSANEGKCFGLEQMLLWAGSQNDALFLPIFSICDRELTVISLKSASCVIHLLYKHL